MSLRFFNTLTREIEEFQPIEPNRVRMYTCGPTVYDYAPIGNFRATSLRICCSGIWNFEVKG